MCAIRSRSSWPWLPQKRLSISSIGISRLGDTKKNPEKHNNTEEKKEVECTKSDGAEHVRGDESN